MVVHAFEALHNDGLSLNAVTNTIMHTVELRHQHSDAVVHTTGGSFDAGNHHSDAIAQATHGPCDKGMQVEDHTSTKTGELRYIATQTYELCCNRYSDAVAPTIKYPFGDAVAQTVDGPSGEAMQIDGIAVHQPPCNLMSCATLAHKL